MSEEKVLFEFESQGVKHRLIRYDEGLFIEMDTSIGWANRSSLVLEDADCVTALLTTLEQREAALNEAIALIRRVEMADRESSLSARDRCLESVGIAARTYLQSHDQKATEAKG